MDFLRNLASIVKPVSGFFLIVIGIPAREGSVAAACLGQQSVSLKSLGISLTSFSRSPACCLLSDSHSHRGLGFTVGSVEDLNHDKTQAD